MRKASALAALAGLAVGSATYGQFSGPYAPGNWTFNANGGNGSVDTSGAPASIALTGNDNGLAAINTDFTIAAASSGIWSFHWVYNTPDTGTYDSAHYLINGVATQLANNTTPGASGDTAVAVAAGDVIGYRVYSADGVFGPGTLVVSSFGISAGAVGRCCLPSGTCQVNTQANCNSAGGTYGGNGTNCSAPCPPPPGQWIEQGDAGDLPSTAQVTTGSGSLNTIQGTMNGIDVDMYRISICNSGSFGATTVGGANWDTKLFLFNSTGMGVTMNDDSVGLQSTLSAQFIPGNGTYYIAVCGYPSQADSAGGNIWLLQPFGVERQPDGPGAGSPVSSWSGVPSVNAPYSIGLTGTCYAQAGGGSTCYANCDLSTTNPFLNVLDFSCFLNKFAAGNTYANCDGSTIQPVLNVLDFSCFLNKFAAGCSAP
jgi:hypothetical protein